MKIYNNKKAMLKKLANKKDLNLLPRCRFFLALGVTLSIAIKKTLSWDGSSKKEPRYNGIYREKSSVRISF